METKGNEAINILPNKHGILKQVTKTTYPAKYRRFFRSTDFVSLFTNCAFTANYGKTYSLHSLFSLFKNTFTFASLYFLELPDVEGLSVNSKQKCHKYHCWEQQKKLRQNSLSFSILCLFLKRKLVRNFRASLSKAWNRFF